MGEAAVDILLPHNGWLPRSHQMALWQHLQKGGERAFAVWHRRAGKDEICLHHAACAAMKRTGNYWHCLPEFLQGRKAIWTAVNAHTGKRRIDEAFPPYIRDTTNDNEMFIRFVNGSTWQVIGSDRYDATVGAGVAGITYSEWALANPSAWAYHRPMLAENKGWAAFITTPRGHNHAKALFDHARNSPDWFCELLTARDTGALTEDELEEALAEYCALYGDDVGRAQFLQEYHCNWNSAILGAFYALEMAAVRNEERITEIAATEGVPVHRAWDLGIRDDTAIWWFQNVGGQVFLLDHYAASGVGVEHYAEVIEARGREHGWRGGTDYVPHDAKIKEWGSGKTRIETMLALGLRPELVPLATIADGINAVRRLLPLCVFHPRCEEGVTALEQYAREWDDEKKAFRASAVHNWTSHSCLTGEALIDLEDGKVPIADVRVGDLVKTPRGLSRVVAAGPVKHADELIEIALLDGRTLRGTPEHKVFTVRGLVCMDQLRCSDEILSEEMETWSKIRSYSTEKNIGFRDATIAVTIGEKPAPRTFTARFGPKITGQFRTAMTSITSMVTASTTILQTSNWSKGASIPAAMLLSASPAASCGLPAILPGHAPPNGIARAKGWPGIPRTASELGMIAYGILANAKNAVARFARRIRRGPNSVISIARWRPCDVGEENPLVYDLTVEKHHCYTANGILVSNSDSFRYLALARQRGRRIVAKEPSWQGFVIPAPDEVNRSRAGIVL
jgi:hypothetical protein